MKSLSQKCFLSQVYTNHSVPVMDATILQRKKYAPFQKQAVTGHKSISSLAASCHISASLNRRKMEMGRALVKIWSNDPTLSPDYILSWRIGIPDFISHSDYTSSWFGTLDSFSHSDYTSSWRIGTLGSISHTDYTSSWIGSMGSIAHSDYTSSWIGTLGSISHSNYTSS